MDIEGFTERPSEIATILAEGPVIVRKYHALINLRRPTYAEQCSSRFVHGLKGRPIGAFNIGEVISELRRLLEFYDPIEIIVNGHDVTGLLPIMKERV